MKQFRPMLAASDYDSAKKELRDLNELEFPVYATPKIDGIRCIVHHDLGPVTRSLKPIPNGHIRYKLNPREFTVAEGIQDLIQGFDGELTVGETFQACTSGIMSHGGMPDFIYTIFDLIPVTDHLTVPYTARVSFLRECGWPEQCQILLPVRLGSVGELHAYKDACLEKGYEGCCIRCHNSPYKYGRSTWKQQWLLKIKQFVDAEAEIIGFEEFEHNANPGKRNELGYLEHSTCQDGMLPMDTLGSLRTRVLNGEFAGVEVNIGSGFDFQQRQSIWDAREKLIGKIIKFKYQSHGSKDKPRIPIFLGFRED